jgi:hypothetical protein
VVSNIALAAALVALYALTAYERPTHDAPRRTVLLFAALPTSFFLLAPYSESPFLLASLLAIFWARTDRWGWRVGVASFSACAVRSLGIALVVALVAEALRQRPSGRSQLRRRLPSAAAGLLAPFLYGAWWWSQGESPFHPLQAQAHWHRTPSFPIVTVWHGLEAAWHAVAGAMGSFVFVDAALAVLVLVAATAMWRRLTPTYSIYVWTSLLIPLSYAASWRPLLSVPRFAAVLFPVAWVGEMVVRSRWGFFAVTGLALACQIALAVEFMNWGWIF